MSLLMRSGNRIRSGADALLQFLPAGMTQFCDTTLGDIPLNGAFSPEGLRGEYDFTTRQEPSAPFGPGCFETVYEGGVTHAGNGGGWLRTASGQGWHRLYFGLSMYFSPNYITHSVGEKFFYPFIETPGYALQNSYIDITPDSTDPDPPLGEYVDFGLILQRAGLSPNDERFPSPALNARPKKGEFGTACVYCEMNTPGNANGICRIWYNGNVAMDYSDLIWSALPVQGTFAGLRFTGTRGGSAADRPTPPEGQFRLYNRLAAYYGSAA